MRLLIGSKGFSLSHDSAISIERWRKLKHSNIVTVRDASTTRSFGDNCINFLPKDHFNRYLIALILAYDYHPVSQTMSEKYFSRQKNQSVPEKELWSLICQLASALREAHSNGLALRVVESSKILITSKNRLRVNCCGIFDIIHYDGVDRLEMQQVIPFLLRF